MFQPIPTLKVFLIFGRHEGLTGPIRATTVGTRQDFTQICILGILLTILAILRLLLLFDTALGVSLRVLGAVIPELRVVARAQCQARIVLTSHGEIHGVKGLRVKLHRREGLLHLDWRSI